MTTDAVTRRLAHPACRMSAFYAASCRLARLGPWHASPTHIRFHVHANTCRFVYARSLVSVYVHGVHACPSLLTCGLRIDGVCMLTSLFLLHVNATVRASVGEKDWTAYVYMQTVRDTTMCMYGTSTNDNPRVQTWMPRARQYTHVHVCAPSSNSH